MERLHEYFLHLLKTALQGGKPSVATDVTPEDWAKLTELAAQHHVTPLLFESARHIPALADTEFLKQLRQRSRQQMVNQARKTYDFLQLMQLLHAAGVQPLVVKGIICRGLYPNPDSRPSADEDLLVKAEQLTRCREVLAQFGMQTTTPDDQLDSAYEVPYRSAVSPLYIELHRSLFPPESEAYGDLNRYFTGIFDRAVEETVEGVPLLTMEYTDHLFYLICHAFKHFLHSGFGIRQVCDIILYANTYGSRIRWDELLQHCREIRADRFAAAVFRIGSNHLVFDPIAACYSVDWQSIPVDEMPLLEDLLLGGVYGSASTSRLRSSNITLGAVSAKKQNRKNANPLVASLFLPASRLEGRYPWLKRYPWLLPAAWVARVLQYRKNAATPADAADALKIGEERIALLKEYHII